MRDIRRISEQLRMITPFAITGTIRQTVGMTVTAADFPVSRGATAEIQRQDGTVIPAEVVGSRDHTSILFPYGKMDGICPGDRVRLKHTAPFLRVGDHLLGCVLNAHGEVIPVEEDASGAPEKTVHELLTADCVPYVRTAPTAQHRPRITEPLSTGVRAIDALLTIGRGQRVGIFAGSGVGKSVLLGMISRWTDADVIVLGLIGERGREVNEYIQRELGEKSMKKSVLVVATGDEPAIMRVRAAQTATAVAEYFRDQGKNVLLLVDSLTRVAIAQREIGTAAGETAAGHHGYPPSVFALLPPLVERAGRTQEGSITAIYTVLVEGDDKNEIIADTVRGLLDGHIWLSRKLAEAGHYPAIDILGSISRLMTDICDESHRDAVLKFRRMLAVWKEHEDLISIGAYRHGVNPELDRAIALREDMMEFLRQGMNVTCDLEFAREQLMKLVEMS